MAGRVQRVRYLASFCGPARGPAAGWPHVQSLGPDVFVGTGGRLVYVYDREGALLTAAYEFPAQVWHLELLARGGALLVLCAEKGLFCVWPDRARRPASQSAGDGDEAGDPPVVPVEPAACILPDAALCAFTVLEDVLVTLARGPARWKMQLFEPPTPRGDPGLGAQIGEVELSACSPPAEGPGERPFLPVLYCASPPGSGAPHSSTLEEGLFGLLFGTDASLLQSPVILCGLPDGQLCSVLLKALVTSRWAPADPQTLVKILHHLEEPTIFIGALRTEPGAEDMLDMPCDCLVALGHHGRMLAIKAGRDEAESLVAELREYCLPGPVYCATCGRDGCLYHSTSSGLCAVSLAPGGIPWEPEPPGRGPASLPPTLCPTSLNVCSLAALCVLPGTPEGDMELLALSSKGRLMICSLTLNPEMPHFTQATTANAGHKIKELLSGIGTVSERVSSLKKAVDQRNQALKCLNEAMNVSCVLLSSKEGPRPISCSISTAWSRLQQHDVLTATCLLENRSAFSLERGWALCIRVGPSLGTWASDAGITAMTYTVPVDQLGPGGRREVTLPLAPGEDGALGLPLTVACSLFYSLREVVGGALAPEDPFRKPCVDECPPGMLPEQEGICLPLSEHTVDLLQGLRFPGLSTPPAGLLSPSPDPVDILLGTERAGGSASTRPASLRARYLPPSLAAIRVSAELLRAALEDGRSGPPLCSATLQWLLTDNEAVDAVKAQALSSVQGVAPDGTDVHLTVNEVAVTDLCPAGPLQAVEIQVESSSLASMCGVHHAIIRRMQALVVAQATRGGSSPPDLRLQYLHQMQANHETLLREVQMLRDRLCTEDEASSRATAERLLQLYSQLRSPSLLLL